MDKTILNFNKEHIVDLLNLNLKYVFPDLVSLFLKNNNLKTSNKLLLKFIEKSKIKDETKLFDFLNKRNIILNLSLIEKIFENSLNIHFRKKNGIYYTPENVVKHIINNLNIDSNKKICDLSCGCGIFLLETCIKIHKDTGKKIIDIIEENIFGYDISEKALMKTKILLSLLALKCGEDKEVINFNLESLNSIKLFNNINLKFDIILGNPPYIRNKNIDKSTKNFINDNYVLSSNSGNIDLYVAFIELAFKLLEKEGEIGFITPHNYLNSLYGKNLVKYLIDNKFIKTIIDFNSHQIFEGCLTYTCISIFSNENIFINYYNIKNSDEIDKLNEIKLNELDYNDLLDNKIILHDETTRNNIIKIEKNDNKLGSFKINTGIATLKNNLYFLNEFEKEDDYYIKFYKGKKFLIEESIVKEVLKINKTKSVSCIKNNSRRIIYPYYESENEIINYCEEDLKKKFPNCYNYLIAIKDELLLRDKGNINLDKWFAYGRTQNLKLNNEVKIIVPSMSLKPSFLVCNKKHILFCEGYLLDIKINKKALLNILNSIIMEYYIEKTSRIYSHNFYAYTKQFLKNFSIPNFSQEEISFLSKEKDKKKIDEFLIKSYNLILT